MGPLTQIFAVAKRDLTWGKFDYWDREDDTHCAIGAIRHVTDNHLSCEGRRASSVASKLTDTLSDAISKEFGESIGVVNMNDRKGWDFEKFYQFCKERGI